MSRDVTSRPLRHGRQLAAVAILAVVATACPVDPPAPTSPYHPEALAPGNKIFLNGLPRGGGTILANPGGVTAYPTDAAAGRAVYFDSTLAGSPTSGDHVWTITTNTPATFGIFDGNDQLRLDLGPNTLSWLYSADGSTFGVSRYSTVDPIGAWVDIYDAVTLTLRRSFTWPAGGGFPMIHDLSRDGSRVILRGSDLGFFSIDRPLLTATTSGTDPLVPVVASTGEEKLAFRLTGAGRVVYSAYRPYQHPAYELRSIALDGSDARVLTTYDQAPGGLQTAPEIGSGRVLVQMAVAGSSSVWQVVAIEDSAAATQTVVIDSNEAELDLARYVAPA